MRREGEGKEGTGSNTKGGLAADCRLKDPLPAICIAREAQRPCLALNPAVRECLVLPVYCPGRRPPWFWPGSICNLLAGFDSRRLGLRLLQNHYRLIPTKL